MNREIKFRAFHKETKTMSYGIDIPMLMREKELVLANEFTSYEFMQFTGLLDKNGVDAYENDLAKHPSSKHLFEIVFYKGAFWLQSQEPSLLKNNIKTNISHLEFCEIIGNSFTNPELINK